MNQKEAREQGKHYGYQAGLYGVDDIDPSDYDSKEDYKDALLEAAWESEQHARQFSPWEFVAHEINSAQPDWRVDGLWEAYDTGVEIGIKKGIKSALKKW
jgi:hypothetical protein